MVFVPVVHRKRPPSPKAQELGNELTQIVQRFRQKHPELSSEEVSEAFRLAAEGGTGRKETAQVALAFAVALLIAVGGLLLWALLKR
jgi:hypothetical protein